MVTPSLNQADFLRQNVESVAAQISYFPGWEHIVVDGGSTDHTVEILKANGHIRWISEQDDGQANALNKGIRMARGDWIVWLNADDYLLPGALCALAFGIVADPEAAMVYGHSVVIDESGEFQKTVFSPRHRALRLYFGTGGPPSSGSAFRRAFMLENPLDESYHFIMDSEWLFRTRCHAKASRVDFPTTAFRVWAGAKTGVLHGAREVPAPIARERERHWQQTRLPSITRFRWAIRPLLTLGKHLAELDVLRELTPFALRKLPEFIRSWSRH